MIEKPHLYRIKGQWYCRMVFEAWGGLRRQLGLPGNTPEEAYTKSKAYWHWA